MYLLDLGGGYPGDSNGQDLFNSISKAINSSLEKHFNEAYFNELNGTDEKKLKIIAEPGRYYACSAFTLCTNVIAKRTMDSSGDDTNRIDETLTVKEMNSEYIYNTTTDIDNSKSNMYYINDGVYASFNCLFYDHSVVEPILMGDKCKDKQNLVKSSIWGPTCDGLDLVVKECYIPDLEVGEFLTFKDMGAYTISGAVAFNGIPLARCIYVASVSWSAIKDAFTDVPADDHFSSLLKDVSISNMCAAADRIYTKEDSIVA